MRCPHCLVTILAQPWNLSLGSDIDFDWSIIGFLCPSCSRYVLHLVKKPTSPGIPGSPLGAVVSAPVNAVSYLIHPKATSRQPVPAEVPEEFTADYKEACLVLADSPQGERCTQ